MKGLLRSSFEKIRDLGVKSMKDPFLQRFFAFLDLDAQYAVVSSRAFEREEFAIELSN
jgi:hypothetical protein